MGNARNIFARRMLAFFKSKQVPEAARALAQRGVLLAEADAALAEEDFESAEEKHLSSESSGLSPMRISLDLDCWIKFFFARRDPARCRIGRGPTTFGRLRRSTLLSFCPAVLYGGARFVRL